jgi:hypothetical protein
MDNMQERHESRRQRLRAGIFGWSLTLSLMSCQPIQPVAFRPFADGADAAVDAPMVYYIENTGVPVTVPAGFVTDFASTPRAIWAVLPPFGTYQKAAVIHDYLYWMQECTKDQSDEILYLAMKESNVSPVDILVIYDAVKHFGNDAWIQNSREKEEGLTRFVPLDSSGHPQFAADAVWNNSYRRSLRQTSYDYKSPDTPPYCAVADPAFQKAKNDP